MFSLTTNLKPEGVQFKNMQHEKEKTKNVVFLCQKYLIVSFVIFSQLVN